MNMHTFVILAYKESPYLEECIKSIKGQLCESDIIIATSTYNKYIEKLAQKYNLPIVENKSKNKGIGYDFDFAYHCAKTELMTIAHQDDVYKKEYSLKLLELYKKHRDATLMFSDYYEIRDGVEIYTNSNIKIKRLLLSMLRVPCLTKYKIAKRSVLAFGNAICCPAVTFVKKNIPYQELFASDMKCNVDWLAWEKISKLKGRFLYEKKSLMGHRVHEESTTTEIILDNVRTREDLIMFKKFWPLFIAKLLNKLYIKSEKSNKV